MTKIDWKLLYSLFNQCCSTMVTQLIVYNGAKSDAIICLYNLSKRKVIRNEYVRKNTNYTIFKIPQGRYKIKVLFGNDWNPEKVKFTGIKGYFDSDISCTEFDQEDFHKSIDKQLQEKLISQPTPQYRNLYILKSLLRHLNK